MTDREAFEKWAESNGFDADKTDEGIYRVKSTQKSAGVAPMDCPVKPIFDGEIMTNTQVERDADEAFSIFWKRWHSVCPAELRDIGEPTQIEVWHHAWRASMIAERERCIRLCEGMPSAQNSPFDCADAIRMQTEFLPRK